MSQLKVNTIRHTGASSDAITLASDGTCTAKITNNLSNRNLIINGSMICSQRGTSFADPADNAYTLDRWKTRNPTGTPAFTWTQDSESPDGFACSLKCDCTTADTSLAAGEFCRIEYHAEGQDLQAFAKGTSSAKKGILSFYVKTNKTGVYVVNFYDNDNSRGFSASYTVSDSNWNRYTISIPADTTGAWGNDTGASLGVNWGLAIGSSRNSGSTGDLPTAWGSHASNTQFAGQVNFADSTSNDFYITGIQLEVDSTGSGVATDFEHRSYGDELRRCQRYFTNLGLNSSSGQALGVSVSSSASTIKAVFHFPTAMRATPSFTYDDITADDDVASYANNNISSLSGTNAGSLSANLYFSCLSFTATGRPGRVVTTSAGGYIYADSEL